MAMLFESTTQYFVAIALSFRKLDLWGSTGFVMSPSLVLWHLVTWSLQHVGMKRIEQLSRRKGNIFYSGTPVTEIAKHNSNCSSIILRFHYGQDKGSHHKHRNCLSDIWEKKPVTHQITNATKQTSTQNSKAPGKWLSKWDWEENNKVNNTTSEHWQWDQRLQGCKHEFCNFFPLSYSFPVWAVHTLTSGVVIICRVDLCDSEAKERTKDEQTWTVCSESLSHEWCDTWLWISWRWTWAIGVANFAWHNSNISFMIIVIQKQDAGKATALHMCCWSPCCPLEVWFTSHLCAIEVWVANTSLLETSHRT